MFGTLTSKIFTINNDFQPLTLWGAGVGGSAGLVFTFKLKFRLFENSSDKPAGKKTTSGAVTETIVNIQTT